MLATTVVVQKHTQKLKTTKTRLLYSIIIIYLVCTIITVYILPISVVLPMGGECTNAGKVIPQNHKDTSTSNVTTNKQTGKRKRSSNNKTGKGVMTMVPKRTGRPSNFTNHICSQCTIWKVSGCLPHLHKHHQSVEMKHPGRNFQEISNYASYGGVTIGLNPDSCICQNCFRDYYRNPTKPWWYRKHEEFIPENGEVGAELEIHSEPEGACEGQGTEDTTESDDTEDSDVMENERDGGIDKQQIKSVIDHALLRLREEGCVYSKDLTHMIRTQPAKALRQLYKELDKHIKSKGYKYYFTNRKLGKLIYHPDQFSDQAIKYVYKLLHISMSKLQEQTTKCISEEKIRKLITKQCSKLPCAVSYDYRKLVDRNGSLNAEALDKHFDPDLNDLEKITTSDKSKHRVEEGYTKG